MDGADQPIVKKTFHRSSSFSASSHRAAIPPPPPLSISRPPILFPHIWPSGTADSATDSGSSACRRGQLVFFDRECSRVEDHLYIGSDLVARDRDALRLHGITHILSCVGSPELFRPDVKYKTLWLSDTPSQDITSVLYDVFDYFEEVRCSKTIGARVLVHCSRGVSRSAALVVAYLMWLHSLPFDAALRRVRAARPVTDPNLGFASQLLSLQSRLLREPATPFPWCRFYRIAPHSPYDPLHLVPKPLDRRPSTTDLDSRGAFILHVASAVYVWIGTDCEETMASSARATASQIVRYEHAVGPVVDVHEGSEPLEFCNSFGGNSPQFWDLGTKRAEDYDLDFEIFLRAIKSGVLPPFFSRSQSGSPKRLPAKGGGWLRLKQRLLVGGVKELVTCCSVPLLEDRELEPFGSPQSTLSQDSSTLTSSDFSSLSPSSSDWCGSPSLRSEFYYEGELLLLKSGGKSPSFPSAEVSVVERRESAASHLACSPRQDEVDEHDAIKEWPFSPFRLAVEDGDGMMEIENPAVQDADRMPADEDDSLSKLTEPALYKWPNIEKVDNLHPGVLDSKSVFLLLAPDSNSKKYNHKILYVWVGGKSEPLLTHTIENAMNDTHDRFLEIGQKFLVQMGFSIDIPVQVVREEEEPEQFLNHLFTFHQSKEKCDSYPGRRRAWLRTKGQKKGSCLRPD